MNPCTSHTFLFRLTLLLLASFLGVSTTHAAAAVHYDPTSKAVYNLALPSVSSYTLNVTAPADITGFPITVALRVEVLASPAVDTGIAASYVRVPRTVTFWAPGEVVPVEVTLDFPLEALSPGVPSGSYQYILYTDGWPDGVQDAGSGISAGVVRPNPANGSIPTVRVQIPSDGTVFTYQPTSFPVEEAFTFTATASYASPAITAATATVTQPATATLNAPPAGIGTRSVTGAGKLRIPAPGTYVIKATATNSKGEGSDLNSFTVRVLAAKPTVSITTPSPGATFQYRTGEAPTLVPVEFVATSSYGGIRSITATVDGADATKSLNVSGIDTLTATGTLSLSFESGGSHEVVIQAHDDNGSGLAETRFTVEAVSPEAVVDITAPTAAEIFIPSGQVTTTVNYRFTTTLANGFVVDSVSASLDGKGIEVDTVGMLTPVAVSTGTLTLGPGTYTLIAKGGIAAALGSDQQTFTVRSSDVPPTVTLNTPTPDYTATLSQGATLEVPLSFTGTSHNPHTSITQLSATVNGADVNLSTDGIGEKSATGTATLSITEPGTYEIVVTATDQIATATAVGEFTVTEAAPKQASGTVFFDLNGNGIQDGADFGLGAITVKLVDSAKQVSSTVTDPAGVYTFTNVYAGSFAIVVDGVQGMVATTPTERLVEMGGEDVLAAPIGFQIDFNALRKMKAGGYTIGFWKNNLDKAISGKTHGTQVSAETLTAYTTNLADFALAPYDGLTMKSAVGYLDKKGSSPADLLAKQLLASEYNYQNRAYLNGNATLTYAFVSWGEAILATPGSFSPKYILWAKDWFDAYNNSHGGYVAGPAP